MATPFDVANFNLTNFADNYNSIFDSTPATVSIDVKDDLGNITTKSVENRGLFKQQLWDDVGAAVGQFNKTVYVDAINGDDLNSGSSTSPLKTLSKSFSSIPISGAGTIVFLSDIDIANETANSLFSDRSISISLNGFTLTKSTTNNIFILSADKYGYLKIYNTVSTITPEVSIDNKSAEDLIRVIDCSSDIVIGDYDSPMTVYTDSSLIWGARSNINYLFNRVEFEKPATYNLSTVGAIVVNDNIQNLSLNDIACAYINCHTNVAVVSKQLVSRPNINFDLYVDQLNGSPYTSGLDVNNPTNNLAVLLSRLPKTQQLFTVYIIGDYVHNSSVTIYGNIKIIAHSSTPNASLTVETTSTGGSSLNISYGDVNICCNLTLTNTYDAFVRVPINAYSNASFSITIKPDMTNSMVTLNDGTCIISIDRAKCSLNYIDIVTANTNYNFIYLPNKTADIYVNTGVCTLNGAVLTEADVVAETINVIKDVNGVPRNVTSNIIF